MGVNALYGRHLSTKPLLGAGLDWSHPLANGLLGYWVLNEQGGTILSSLSGDAQGAIQGANLNWASGSKGPALKHASQDNASFAQFSASLFDFDKNDPFSIEVWVYVADGTVATGLCVILGNLNAVGLRGTFIKLNQFNANDVQFATRNSGSDSLDVVTQTVPATVTGQWNHIIVTKSAAANVAGTRIYTAAISRSLSAASDSLTATTKTGANWALGRAGAYANFGGVIGTAYLLHRIWNRVLSPAEVLWLYTEPHAMILQPTYRRWFIPAAAGWGLLLGQRRNHLVGV